MHIKDIDLNLLRLFDAVYRTRNVSRAAELLDLTQPAASPLAPRFWMIGAKTDGGYPFQLMVEELQAEGVKFKVCNNTLIARHVDPGQVLDDVEIVTSGVAELARLQAREGYGYIKP